MIKLYGGGQSRWVKPYWTMKELGIDFEPVVLNILQGEPKKPEFQKTIPFGKLPVLSDGDFTLFESSAICTYLGDKHPESGLVPKAGSKERAAYDQWLSFCTTELEQPAWRITKHKFLLPEAKRSQAEIELAQHDFLATAASFERIIGDYLVGNRFTVADIVATYTLNWASRYELLTGFPKLKAYAAKHSARPAFPKELYK